MATISDDNVVISIEADITNASGQLEKISKQLENLGAGTGNTEDAFKKFGDVVSGRTVKAINDFGKGVQELLKANPTKGINDFEKEITELAKEATKAGIPLDVLEKEMLALQSSSDKAGTGTDKFKFNIIALNQALDLAGRAFGLFKQGASFLDQSLEQAGKVDALSRSFTKLQESVGNNANESLEKFRQTTQGLVSDLDIFQVANKAVLLNLPTEGFQEAAASAIQLGRAMGITAKEAIDDFTTGVGRGSVMILDNLGIIVDAEKAYQDFAKANKLVASELTDGQKKTAFATEAYRAITEAAKNTANVSLNASDAYQVVQVSLQNLGTQALQTLANNNELRDAFIRLNGILQDIDVTQLVNGLATIASYAVDTIGIIAELTSSLIRLFSVDNVRLDQTIRQLGSNARSSFGYADEATQKFLKGINEVGQIGKLTGQQFDFVANKIADYRKQVESSNISDKKKIAIIDDLVSVQSELKMRTLQVDEATSKFNRTNKDTETGLGKTEKELREAEKAAKKYAEELSKLRDVISNTTNNEIADFQSELFQLGITTRESLAEQASAVEDLAIEYVNLGRLSLPEATKAIDDFVEANKKANEEITEELEKANEERLKIEQAFQDERADIANQAGEDFIRALLNGGTSEDYKEIAKQGAGELADSYVTELTGSEFAGDISRVLTEELTEGIFGAFSGNKNAAANLRQSLQKFLNNTIKDLKLDISQIFINDGFGFQLPNGRNAFNAITDPLTGEITTSAEQALENLSIPQGLLDTFDGIGRALALSLGEGGNAALEVLNQFGTLLAINFQDAKGLNDLQLILEGAGLSAEQLTEQLENAFLLGDLKAEEFLGSLASTRDLFQQGIPGAIGATDLAFQNLVSGGLQSGRQAFDALGDIASEAGEKGIDSFSALRTDLIASGKSVSEVDKLLQALANNGIDSIEELRNISVEQTAGVVTSLNNMAFGFEAITADVKNLADEVEKIKSKKVDIEFNVKTNYDTNTQALLNNPTTSQYIPQVGNA